MFVRSKFLLFGGEVSDPAKQIKDLSV